MTIIPGNITTTENMVRITGAASIPRARKLYSLARSIAAAGFPTIKLDLSGLIRIDGSAALVLVVACQRLRRHSCRVTVTMPWDHSARKFLVNSGLAHLLSPLEYRPTHEQRARHVPVLTYVDLKDLHPVYCKMMDYLLANQPDLERRSFASLEWCLWEVTDNVLNHAACPDGGAVLLRSYTGPQKTVEYMIADSGVGIPGSLRPSFPTAGTDSDLIELALQEGVTRDRSVGVGNGLFGSYQVAVLAGGHFEILSGTAQVTFRPSKHVQPQTMSSRGGLKVQSNLDEVPGTLVRAGVNLKQPDLLVKALAFGGKVATPADYIEKYEQVEDSLAFPMAKESSYFGTREGGRQVRTKVENLIGMTSAQRFVIDMADVLLVSSSFADEVFGRLAQAMGIQEFRRAVSFRSVHPTVQHLIDRAIQQRTSL